MGMWNALIETLKELIKGIPSWAKVVLSFAIAGVLLTVAVLNYKLVLVYDVHIDDPTTPIELRQYTVEHLQSKRVRQADERQWFDVYLEVGIADRQNNEIIIRRKPVVTGGQLAEVRYAFESKSWTSGVFNFDIRCDFAAKECKRLSTKNYESIHDASAPAAGSITLRPGWAEAAEAKPAADVGIVVPTLATLRRVATEGGYIVAAFRKFEIVGDPCRLFPSCKGTFYAEIEWNGKRLLYDGLKGAASGYFDVSVAADRKVVGEIVLALENVLFTEAENQLAVKLFPRGAAGTAGEPTAADAFIQRLVLFRDVKGVVVKSQGGHLQAELEARTYRDEFGRVYELFIASGPDERAVRSRAEIFQGRVRYQFQGMPVVGMLRPPLPPNQNWGLVAGVKSPDTGRVRILFTQEEVKKLQAELRTYLLNQGLRTLQPETWFVYKIRDIQ
jgi:hypothetical protein